MLLHYKFDRAFGEWTLRQAERLGRHRDAPHYRAMHEQVMASESFSLRSESSRPYTGPDELVEVGFLQVTDRWTAFVEQNGKDA